MSAAFRHDVVVRRCVAAIGAIVTLHAEPLPAQVSPRLATAEQRAAVDALFKDYAAAGAPGAAVVVSRGDTIVFARGYGLADVEGGVPVTPSTSFRLASVTKQFTAAAILTLVDAGTLDLDDTLGELLPNTPSYAQAVTVRQLLAHTSGLPDYEPILGRDDGPQVKDRDVLMLLHKAKNLYFKPGTSWRYSNSGYALLALVVERVTGETFAHYLRRRVFAPAGMLTAVAHADGVDTVSNRAYGHGGHTGAWRRTDQNSTSAVLGDGGIYASAEELAHWSDALGRNVVLSAKTFHEMTTPATLPSRQPTNYGFGWFLDTHRGHRRQRHEGDSIGFRTAIQRYPDDHLTVVVLINRGAAPIDALSDGVANLFLDR